MGKALPVSQPTADPAGLPPGVHAERPADAPIVERFRRDVPSLAQTVHKHPLVYLDNAATTQRPVQVIDAIRHASIYAAGNVHRGVHLLSARATEQVEDVRHKVAQFVNAPSADEVIFTRGTTESINLVAHSFGQAYVAEGDEVIITELEHHSNIVPWQRMCEERRAILKVAPILDNGDLDYAAFESLLTERTKMVAVTHVSNAIGSVLPVQRIAAAARAVGAYTLIDGAQAVVHMPVDVQALGCDFYVFSGHKVFGPTGVGVLWGKAAVLEAMPPYQTGGGMIAEVGFEKTTFAQPPQRFEAGTPAILEIIGLGAALDYLSGPTLNWDALAAHEASLMKYAKARMAAVPHLSFVGEPDEQMGVISFTMEDAHPHDIGTILDMRGIAIRSGHHCAQPLMRRLGVQSTARVSFAGYNIHREVDTLVEGLMRVQNLFARSRD